MIRKPSVPTEHHEQVAVMRWAALCADLHPDLRWLYAIPNGARTSIGTARKLKAEGLKSGVPDLCLPVPRGVDHITRYNGLYLELKRTRGGVVSATQREWHQALIERGYSVHVCRGATEAIHALCRYLNISHEVTP